MFPKSTKSTDPGFPESISSREITDACIFVIDDEPIVSDVISFFLDECGFSNVHCFNDSIEAIETLQYVKAELVITDVSMPGLAGNYLTKLAKKMEHLREVPILVVTSDTSSNTESKCLASGAMKVLPKPVDRQQLVMGVVEALDQIVERSEIDTRYAKKMESLREEEEQRIRDQEIGLRNVCRAK